MHPVRIHRPALALATLAASAALADTTVSFQQGVNGYTGQVNALVTTTTPATPDASYNKHGSLALDGLDLSDPTNSPDTQGLIRFDNLFGSGPGQIPVGAFVINASLTVTTFTGASSPSGGPYAVAPLTAPFDPATVTWNSYVKNSGDAIGTGGNVGPWYQTGTTARPLAGFGATTNDTAITSNITSMVRNWANGSMANNGFAIQSGYTGTTDGWTIDGATNATASKRPQLSVTYTTDPVHVATLQQGVNGYTGTTMKQFEHYQGQDLTNDGAGLSQSFLDIEDATTAESRAGIKFADIASSANIPAGAVVRSAYLVITTGETSANARSGGTWEVDELPSEMTDSSNYSDFGAAGPAGTKLASVTGINEGAQAWFDVTTDVARILAGGTDNGWVIRSSGTGDGWMIDFTGADDATTRPQLVIAYSDANTAVPEPAALASIGIVGIALLRRRRA